MEVDAKMNVFRYRAVCEIAQRQSTRAQSHRPVPRVQSRRRDGNAVGLGVRHNVQGRQGRRSGQHVDTRINSHCSGLEPKDVKSSERAETAKWQNQSTKSLNKLTFPRNYSSISAVYIRYNPWEPLQCLSKKEMVWLWFWYIWTLHWWCVCVCPYTPPNINDSIRYLFPSSSVLPSGQWRQTELFAASRALNFHFHALLLLRIVFVCIKSLCTRFNVSVCEIPVCNRYARRERRCCCTVHLATK